MVKALQSEIIFAASPAAAPIATPEEVEWLVSILKGRGWLKASAIESLSGGTKNDRKIRAIARAAGHGIVSHPGSPGYKLWSECTMEEIHHCLSAWQSQINDNTVRLAGYERAYHGQYRGLS